MTAFAISHDFNDAVRAVLIRLPSGAIGLAFALRYYLHRTREDPAWGWAMVNLSAGGPIFGEETARYAMSGVEVGIINEHFSAPNASVGFDLVMGTSLAAMITLLNSERQSDYPEQIVAQIYRGLRVSDTLIEKCIRPSLPDPFVFLKEHGLELGHDLTETEPFIAYPHRK